MAHNRYAILHHKLPDSEHWDLLLEQDQALATWQLLAKPTGPGALPIIAMRIADHRKKYLVYEGPLANQGGVVTRFDHGNFRTLQRDEQRWLISLSGQVLFGRFCLVQPPDQPPESWLLTTV